MNTAFESIKPEFDKYKNHKHVEFELRLGKVITKGGRGVQQFDTNVGYDVFHQILEGLKNYQDWESVKESEVDIFYDGERRYIFEGDSDDCVACIKKKNRNVNLKLDNKPLDVRFGIATETPIKNPEVPTEADQKSRKRWSFIRNNLSIDMSIVKGGGAFDPDSEDEAVFQVELEIIDPSKVTSVKELYNICWKVEDILKLLENK
tara:strand:+ start:20200 stop:20814 length:615 start_codon:yes stop_codon:yes gene_type:complete